MGLFSKLWKKKQLSEKEVEQMEWITMFVPVLVIIGVILLISQPILLNKSLAIFAIVLFLIAGFYIIFYFKNYPEYLLAKKRLTKLEEKEKAVLLQLYEEEEEKIKHRLSKGLEKAGHTKVVCPFCQHEFYKYEAKESSTTKGNILRGIVFLPWGIISAAKRGIVCPKCEMKLQ